MGYMPCLFGTYALRQYIPRKVHCGQHLTHGFRKKANEGYSEIIDVGIASNIDAPLSFSFYCLNNNL